MRDFGWRIENVRILYTYSLRGSQFNWELVNLIVTVVLWAWWTKGKLLSTVELLNPSQVDCNIWTYCSEKRVLSSSDWPNWQKRNKVPTGVKVTKITVYLVASLLDNMAINAMYLHRVPHIIGDDSITFTILCFVTDVYRASSCNHSTRFSTGSLV